MARNASFRERTARRLNIVGARTRHSLPGSAPKYRSVYFHLPKCGGTSLSEGMYGTVPFNHRIGVLDAVSTRRATALLECGKDDAFLCHEDLDTGQKVFDLREAMLLQHMAWDTMLIHGHVLWSDTAFKHFGETYKFVTLMRDPLARTLSNFRMGQRTGVVQGDLEAYLETEIARRQARVFLRYLYGRNDIAEADVPAAVEVAKQRLSHFAIIGFLDHIDTFLNQYKDLFGVRPRMSKLNAAPDQRPDYSGDLMARLEALCAPDREIYEFAKSLA